MHPREYEEKWNEFMEIFKDRVFRKLKEYGSSDNALESVDLQAKAEGRTPESQIMSLEGKHHMSLSQYAKHLDKGGDWKVFCDNLTEGITDKMVDSCVYFFMLFCCFHRRSKGKE